MKITLLLCITLILLLSLSIYSFCLFKTYKCYRHINEFELLKHKNILLEFEASHAKLMAELESFHFLDSNGVICENCYKTAITHYGIYNHPLVTFLCNPNLKITHYESVIYIFVCERLTIEDIERKLGKNRGALNKAIFRIKEKMHGRRLIL